MDFTQNKDTATFTSKQRAELRALANKLDVILQLGKNEIGDAFINQVNEAIDVREMIKIKVLENSMYTAKEASHQIATATNSTVVQVIGSVVTLYKRNEKDPVIEISGYKKKTPKKVIAPKAKREYKQPTKPSKSVSKYELKRAKRPSANPKNKEN